MYVYIYIYIYIYIEAPVSHNVVKELAATAVLLSIGNRDVSTRVLLSTLPIFCFADLLWQRDVSQLVVWLHDEVQLVRRLNDLIELHLARRISETSPASIHSYKSKGVRSSTHPKAWGGVLGWIGQRLGPISALPWAIPLRDSYREDYSPKRARALKQLIAA